MSDGIGDVLWRPGPDRIAGALVTRFAAAAGAAAGRDLGAPAALHAWSVDDPAAFWRAVWDFTGVIGEGGIGRVLVDGDRMPGARWFPDVRLNFAENLLADRAGADPVALVFRDETGATRRTTRDELRAAVAALAAALRADGIGPGDRVAGFLPNIPAAVVAMLATASIGAVWSSCSPDFGRQGVLDRFGQIAPRVLFTADGYRYGGREIDSLATAAELRAALPSLERVVVAGFLAPHPALPDGATAWDDYLAPHAGAAPQYERLPFDHPLYVMYSSGTTGLPKCMVHGAGGTLLQHLKEHQLHGDLRPGEKLFYFTTCGWMMWNWLVSGLASGATVMLYDGHPLNPRTVLWDYAADEGIAVLGTSARWLAACEKAGLRPRDSHDLGALRAVLSTGSPLAPESFDWVYDAVKPDLQLSSISGGTDIISCFALGSPVLPVRRGELQCRGLGMAVAVWDDEGHAVAGAKGELVCTRPFPSMPTGFWNDDDGSRYRAAYFERFPGVWCHGDFAELRPGGGLVIHGRSDAVLNPGGVRIGTAEISRVVDQFPEVLESVLVGLERKGDVQIGLFVKLQEGLVLDQELKDAIRARIRAEKSPRHVPAVVRQVPDIPRTISGKTVELAVRDVLHGRPVKNRDALANPEALEHFARLRDEIS
ncbi:acetoacetate--CoA ligase [bacterium]|nr:acetoacetate--CoA ligase [bacterium]